MIDVKTRMIHQTSQPDGGTYRDRREVPFGENLSAKTIAGLTIPTDTL